MALSTAMLSATYVTYHVDSDFLISFDNRLLSDPHSVRFTAEMDGSVGCGEVPNRG